MKNKITVPTNEDRLLRNKRKKYNNKILKLIKDYLKQHDDFRFIQALTILSVVTNMDRFHEESEVTFNRIQNKLVQIKNMEFKIGLNENEH